MTRKDCFFGLHFDFHANEKTRDIGKNFNSETLRRIITEVKPDYIQCDTKGHPGYSSYKTKAGNPAPHLCADLLLEWRKVTKECGVLLFSHYSGLLDGKALSDNPDWAATDICGKPTGAVSVFGKYADVLLIPQLSEIATEYGVDGAWIDGECWADTVDYSECARKEKQARFGKNDISKKEYLGFLREYFFKYVKHYITEIKKIAPDFELTSNWLNTAWVPDDVALTDYISGDLSPTNSVDSARFDGRIMQASERNWDIMSWGISMPVHYSKSAVQLCQEASVIMSLGGGFQIYNMQSPQNVVMDEWAISIWAKVASFCRKYQPFCQYGKIIPDVAVVYSAKAYYDCLETPFYRDCKYNMELYGILTAFCDCGKSVSVVLSEKIAKGKDISGYKTLIVSDLSSLEDGVKEKLIEYANRGGNLILCGENTVGLFSDDIGIHINPCDGGGRVAVIQGEDYAAEIRVPYLKIKGGKTVVSMNECVVDGDLACINPPPSIMVSSEKTSAFSVLDYGKGHIGIMPMSLGKIYFDDNFFELKKFFSQCAKACCDSRINATRAGQVDVVLSENHGKEYIHVINITGEHRSPRIKTFDYIPAVADVIIKYKTARKPNAVLLQPDNTLLKYEYKDETLTVGLEKIDIYDVIEIQNL